MPDRNVFGLGAGCTLGAVCGGDGPSLRRGRARASTLSASSGGALAETRVAGRHNFGLGAVFWGEGQSVRPGRARALNPFASSGGSTYHLLICLEKNLRKI